MGVLGVGMGLMISQLGNVIQSSVEESGRSEAGGLQFTGQQLGSALGVAFIGAIVLIGLTNTFTSTVTHDSRISAEVSNQVGVAAGSGLTFVSSDQVESAAQKAGLDKATTAAVVDDYETAQLRALKAGLLGAAFLALISLAFTRELPHEQPDPRKKPDPAAASTDPGAPRRQAQLPATAPGRLTTSECPTVREVCHERDQAPECRRACGAGESCTRADTAVGSFGVGTGRGSAGSGGVARGAERDA